ncbi:MAG: OB-fold-containig protein [Novosphingobium sp.]
MFSWIFSSSYLPFAIAFVVMIGIGLIEAVGLGLGNLDIGGDADADAGLLDWLGLGGEMPILIWITSLLACFTLVGIAVQQGMTAIAGTPLPPMWAVGAAIIVGTLLNTVATNGLARILPGFETTVISTDELLRRRGIILEGLARRGVPARAKVVDQHGQHHYIMVEPHNEADTIAAGETALIVRREGQLFYALPDKDSLLSSI